MLRSIESDTVTGLRDRALIGVMVFTFARISAACGKRGGVCREIRESGLSAPVCMGEQAQTQARPQRDGCYYMSSLPQPYGGKGSRAMCDGIVLNGRSITTITTVERAEEVFGKKAIVWNP